MRARCRDSLTGVVALLAILLAAPGAAARDVVVIRTDGSRVEGELVADSDEQIVLMVEGVRTPIARADVQRVEEKMSVDAVYRQRREALADDDLEGRYVLAYWLYEQKAYGPAMAEVTSLRAAFPEDRRVASLIKVIEERMKLRRRGEQDAGADMAAPAEGAAPAPGRPELDKHGLPARRLTAEQANLIRVLEVDLGDRPNIVIPPKTIDAFLDRFGSEVAELRGNTNQRRFRGARGEVQLGTMFRLAQNYPGIRSLYKDVMVTRDPPAMQTFRTRIHRSYVLNYCATRSCHGGAEAGRLFLFTAKPSSVETVYTNFYILDAYRGEGRFNMVDRQEPANSMLIDYGMPRSEARVPHPEVRGWRPRLRSRTDSLAKTIARWVRQLQPLRPDYMIRYVIPDLRKAAPPEAEADKPQEPEGGGDDTDAGRDEAPASR